MNCKAFKEDLALAAAGALEPGRLAEVEQHCRRCPGCAARLRDFQRLASAHRHAAQEIRALPLPDVRRPRLATTSAPRRAVLAPNWRWLLPLGATVGLAVTLVVSRKTPPPSDQSVVRVQPEPVESVSTSPSLAVYRRALDREGEAAMEALLTRHERHLLQGAPAEDLRQLRGQL